jgi:fumarylacetoacetase
MELTWRGTEPIALNDEEQRQWLEDGDELIMTGWCQGNGYRIGFGEVTGVIEPALEIEQALGTKSKATVI